MSTKVKRYGWKALSVDHVESRHEYTSCDLRDADTHSPGWRKYTVTRTVRGEGRPLWWAIRQLQEGRAVVDGDGTRWKPNELSSLCNWCVNGLPDWAQSWTLAVPK